MQDAKQKQFELALSRMGAKVSLAIDEMLQAEKEVKAASQKLMEIQQEIEQIYLTLNEPFIMVDNED